MKNIIFPLLFKEHFDYKDERSTFIVSCAQIEYFLEMFLKSYLKPSPYKDKDDLFDIDKPLSSLSSKINMSYRLNLINKDMHDVLNWLRKLRNNYAHGIEFIKLIESPNKEYCNNILNVMKITKIFSKKRIWNKDRVNLNSEEGLFYDIKLSISHILLLFEFNLLLEPKNRNYPLKVNSKVKSPKLMPPLIKLWSEKFVAHDYHKK